MPVTSSSLFSERSKSSSRIHQAVSGKPRLPRQRYFVSTNGFETFGATFASEPRRLHAAKRNGRAGELHAIDGHHREIQATHQLEDDVGSGRADVGSQAVFRIVRLLHNFIKRVESADRGDGSEVFFVIDAHARRSISDDRRLVEPPAQCVRLPAGQDTRPFARASSTRATVESRAA